mgnify:FL=1
MPYGRRTSYRSMGGTSRRVSFAKSRSTVKRRQALYKARRGYKPVRRIQAKKYVPKQIKNTQSIYALSRKVVALQKSQIGMYQTRREYLTSWPVSDSATVRLTNVTPICFAVNDFISQVPNGAQLYITNQSNQILQYVQQWRQSASSPVPAADMNHDMNINSDSDVTQLDHYQGISSTITFEFSYPMRPSDEPEFIRVDIVKPKRGRMLVNSSVHSYMLPNAIQGFTNLAQDPLNRNRINRDFYTVLQTKYCVLKNTRDTGSAAAQIKKYMKIHVPLYNKMHKTNLGDYARTGETWNTNTPMSDQIWCIISTSLEQGAGAISRQDPPLKLNACRDLRFRDNGGSTQ